MMTFPIPAASATAEPDMPEKIKLATTFTWPRPPLKPPTNATQNFKRRSDIFPAFIIFAETMNKGTARSKKPSKSLCTIVSPAMARSCPAIPR